MKIVHVFYFNFFLFHLLFLSFDLSSVDFEQLPIVEVLIDKQTKPHKRFNYDLTVVGSMNNADGLGRISIGIIDILKDELKINFIPTGKICKSDLKTEVKKIAYSDNKTPGRVCIFTDQISWKISIQNYQYVPDCEIKIAYSMFESTKIPPVWVEVLNSMFDAVVVPDPFLVDVYQNSGVNIPIFVIPLGMNLDNFLKQDPHSFVQYPFVFGGSASYFPHKNIDLMIRAFAEEFGNSDQVILKIHGRQGMIDRYQDFVKSLGISNIIFSTGVINQKEYIDLIRSFDCYINLSKGEGFSLCPREALALGIPCILSHNTAQKTLCNSGFVKSVPSLIKEKASYANHYFKSFSLGYQFNCTLDDAKMALRDMYVNYDKYLELAQLGRQWVFQYSWANLKQKYLNLVKPKEIILGDENIVTDTYLMTNSKSLYNKYKGKRE